jgi:hypothetical protein
VFFATGDHFAESPLQNVKGYSQDEAFTRLAGTSAVKAMAVSSRLQIAGCGLSGPLVLDHVKRQLLAFSQAMHTGAFDRADVDENVGASVLRLNEAKTFLAVEPLHSTFSHRISFNRVRMAACATG